MNQQKTPHLFVATGATKWNDPKNFPWTMGFQPNYQTEGRVYAAHMLKNTPNAKVGMVLRQSYEVTDPTIDSQIVNLKNREWVAWMKKYYPEGALDDQANGYGYNVAILMTHVLKQCGNDLSRENIIRQAANIKNLELPLLIPGIKINTSPTDFAPIEQEQLARFDGEKWAEFGEIFDAFRKK